MNSKELFNKARTKANDLPDMFKTYQLEEAIMKAEVATWLSQVEWLIDGRDIASNLIKTATDTNDMIMEYLNFKYD